MSSYVCPELLLGVGCVELIGVSQGEITCLTVAAWCCRNYIPCH